MPAGQLNTLTDPFRLLYDSGINATLTQREVVPSVKAEREYGGGPASNKVGLQDWICWRVS